MIPDEVPSDIIGSVRFGFYTADEVRAISVRGLTKSDLLDTKKTPVPGGLYDPALGPLKDFDSCKLCLQLPLQCPGHCGHIDLARPIYNPLLFQNLRSLLRIICFHCHKFKMKEEKVQSFLSQLDLIVKGDIAAAKDLNEAPRSDSFSPVKQNVKGSSTPSNSKYLTQQTFTSLQYTETKHLLETFMHRNTRKCENCMKISPTITSPFFGWLNKIVGSSAGRANTILDANLGQSAINSDGSKETPEFYEQLVKDFSEPKHFLPSEAEEILRSVWKNQPQFCKRICDMQCKSSNVSGSNQGYAMFFLKALLVPPNKFRPSTPAASGGDMVHSQNVLFGKVQDSNNILRSLITTEPDNPVILRRCMQLQNSVNLLFDSSKMPGKHNKDATGIRQLLEKKTGILRQKMMGKRVNFACRSVISPDPYLAVNEIGIPPYFALRLTYPERVTPWNVNRLRHAVDNGADFHPGATHYKEKEISYKLQSRSMRNAISRKLHTSRGVLTHSVKGPEMEFEGKVVFRHLQDGDIVLVNRQPTLHKPSMMAHVVRVLKGEKTLRMHYANCSTYNADFDGDEMNVHFPQDEVSRAEAINIVNANKQYIVPTNGEPIRGLIQDHIISAVLLTNKDTFLTRDEYHQLLYASCVPAAAPGSQLAKFGQKVSTLYSGDEMQPLLPAILKPRQMWTGKQVISSILCHITKGQRPFTVDHKGKIPKEYFSENCIEHRMHIYNNELVHGMIDKNQFGKFGLVHTIHELYGADTAGTLLSIFSRLFTLYLQMHGSTCGVDDLLLAHDSELERKRILEKSELQSEEVHCRFTAIESVDVDPLELQKEIEKVIRSNGDSATTRLDRMMSNSLNSLTSEINMILFPNGLLKPFPRNCLSLMTATGAKGGPVNMSQISSLLGQQELEGKRVPRMISGKTLPSFPPWDISCRAGGFISDRFLTGLRPQEYYFHCMAGRDGLVDTAVKTSRSGYLQRCLIKNLEALKVSYDYTVRDADGSIIQFRYGEDGVDVVQSSFISELGLLATNHEVILEKLKNQPHLSKSNVFIKKLPPILKEKGRKFLKEKEKEKAATDLRKEQQPRVHRIKRKELMKLMDFKYQSSLAEPGEAVGVIAAQSIGEPSTQMTLNTFHFAGRGERNVTLGIPRLTEILMNARENISTPVMTCPLLDGKTRVDAEHLASKFRRICVADIVESMEVCIVPFSVRKDQVSTVYKLTMKLYPLDLYPPHSEITFESRKETLEGAFVLAMEEAVSKQMELISKINNDDYAPRKVKSVSNDDDEEEDDAAPIRKDDEDEGDDDDQGADAERRKRQANDEMEYDDGMEKESSAPAEEYDGEPSGFEIEIDPAEADEDFVMGGEQAEAEAEAAVEAEAEPETPKPKAGKKERKSVAGKKPRTAPGRKKKIDRVIYKKAKGSEFEVHFSLKNEPHILLAQIAQKTAKSVYLKQYKNIEQCSVVERKGTDKIELQTAGINFFAFWDLEEYLSINELETNDIHAMLRTYGVEAARATIIKEVKNVFGLYGIQVNIRHLSLIADFMTSNGGFRPMNRMGMGKFSTSPFTKMTFEMASRFIFESAFHGEVDTLESPSASVSLGQPAKLGTGCFDLLQNLGQ